MRQAKQIWKSLSLITFGGVSVYTLINQYPDYFRISQLQELQTIELVRKDSTNIQIPESRFLDVDQELFSKAIEESQQKLAQWKAIQAIPGYVVGVSVRGRNVWMEGNGFADIENGVRCHPGTVMRIASISKSITATLLAKMVQDQKIDLDKSIYEYLSEDQFPRKKWLGESVDITLRQLAAHIGGIRHYKEEMNKKGDKKQSEFDKKEYYIKEYFPTVTESLRLFKDDPLVAKPGTKYVYTTFGYTLISAVMETQMESKNFCKELTKFIRQELGLCNTCLDQNNPIIPNRSRYYCRDEKTGRIHNVPYVDNSYKWAGGGLLSNVPDLLQFGNIMLYSFKGKDPLGRPGYLNMEIVDEMWRPVPNSHSNWGKNKSKGYGIGFEVIRDSRALKAFTAEPPFENLASHSGGAIGASSILIIEPRDEIIVVLIANLQEAGDISSMGMRIAQIFAKYKNMENNIENQTKTR